MSFKKIDCSMFDWVFFSRNDRKLGYDIDDLVHKKMSFCSGVYILDDDNINLLL